MFSGKTRTSTWYMQVVSIPIFFLIFFIGLYQVIVEDNVTDVRNYEAKIVAPIQKIRGYTIEPTCVVADCKIQCNDLDYESFIVALKKTEEQVVDCEGSSIFNLALNNIEFPNGTFDKDFLGDFSKQISGIVEINSTNLNELGPSAFSGPQFQQPFGLQISNSNISMLRKESFKGSKINSFKFLCGETQDWFNVEAEEGVFDDIAKTLAILQINNCRNLTETSRNILGKGNQTFDILWMIDFRNNGFPKLASNTFLNLKNINLMMDLGYSYIGEVELDAFAGIENIFNRISLVSTRLTTFPEGLFRNFPNSRSKGATIDIQSNKWNCSCTLLWFKEFYFCFRPMYFNETRFLCDNKDDYLNVSFCGETTVEPNCKELSTTTESESTVTEVPTTSTTDVSTTESESTITEVPTTSITDVSTTESESTVTEVSTTSTTDASTTVITTTVNSTTTKSPTSATTPFVPTKAPDYLIIIECKTVVQSDVTTDLSNVAELYSLKDKDIVYNITQSKKREYYINIRGSFEDSQILMWHKSNNKSEYTCQKGIKENQNIKMEELVPDTTYVVCLMRITFDDTLEPFDCTSLTTEPLFGDQSWITNKNKLFVVCGIILSLVSTILGTSFTVFYIVRANPALIKERKKKVKKHRRNFNSESSYDKPSIFNEYSISYIGRGTKTTKIERSDDSISVSSIEHFATSTVTNTNHEPSFMYTFKDHK